MKQEVSVELSGGRRLSFETGKLAKQAHGSVVVRTGENVVLATAVSNPDPREGIDFFPLTVDYREYTYAGGRIPGGFIKREGRPSEREILTSRMIDRPIRPLFPEGFKCETQVIAFVLSADTENDPDVARLDRCGGAPSAGPRRPLEPHSPARGTIGVGSSRAAATVEAAAARQGQERLQDHPREVRRPQCGGADDRQGAQRGHPRL